MGLPPDVPALSTTMLENVLSAVCFTPKPLLPPDRRTMLRFLQSWSNINRNMASAKKVNAEIVATITDRLILVHDVLKLNCGKMPCQ